MSEHKVYLPRPPATTGLTRGRTVESQVAPDIERLVRDAAGGADGVWRLSSHGAGPNGTYLATAGRKAITIKLVCGENPERVEQLAKADALVQALPPQAPAVRPLEGSPYRVADDVIAFAYPWIDGRFLCRTEEDLRQAGSAIGRLHAAFRQLAPGTQANVRASATVRGKFLEAVATDLVSGEFDAGPEPDRTRLIAGESCAVSRGDEQILHGDLNRGNILLMADQVFCLDFEDTIQSWGPVEMDIAYALERLSFWPANSAGRSPKLVRVFLENYGTADRTRPQLDGGCMAQCLRFVNRRAVLILAALERRGERRAPSEWKKFYDLWNAADRIGSILDGVVRE